MMNRPIVMVTICWILGSAAGANLELAGLAAAGAGIGAFLLLTVLAAKRGKVTAAVCLAAFCLASAQRIWTDSHNVTGLADLLAAADSDPAFAPPIVDAAGTIVSPVEIDGDRAQFRIAAERIRLSGERSDRKLADESMLVQLKLTEQHQQLIAGKWKRGEEIAISGTLERPSAATNFGGFDYRRYLYGQHVHWLLRSEDAAAVQVEKSHGIHTAALLGYIDSWRKALGDRVDLLYSKEQAGYMKGLVLGISDDLDPARFRQFSQLGLTHILAISGLHVAVYLFAVGLLLRFLRLPRERITMLLIIAVPFYVLISGGSPSVIRAGLMAMLGLAAARLGQLKDGLHLLAAAALLMLIWQPYMLQNVGFQLSFLVTAGLIIGVPPARKLMPQSKRLQWLYDAVTVTIVAQLASFPLTIYYFNQFHLLSLPANLLLVPFISFVVMPLGGASLVLHACWPPAGALVAGAAELANVWTFRFIDGLSAIPFGRMIWASPPVGWIAAYYAGILCCLHAAARRRDGAAPRERLLQDADTRPLDAAGIEWGGGLNEQRSARWLTAAAFVSGLSVIVLLVFAYYPDWMDRSAQVSFIDVGQGDSVLIRTPEGRHILIDGGGSVQFRKQDETWRERRDPYEVGLKTVVPLLMKRGVHELDVLVISHLDSDHIKGLQAVVSSIPVKRVLWNGTMKDSEDAAALMQMFVDRQIPMYEAVSGRGWQLDARTKMSMLSEEGAAGPPSGTQIPLVPEQNGHSVAFLLTMNGRTFLFAGDADAAEEQAIIEQLTTTSASADSSLPPPPPASGIDVMKVSHHGSKTSTTEAWLGYWRPRIAVISVGRNNVYGHPNGSVLERLMQAGASTMRTDRDGEVQIKASANGELSYRMKLAPMD